MQRAILVVAVLAMLQTAAAAQTCEGRPLFSAGGTQGLAGAQFTDGANSIGAGIGMGATAGVYGRALIGTTSFDNLDGSSFDVTAGLGYQVPMGRNGAYQLCPVGNLNFQFGPNDVNGSGFDASGRSVQFGLMLGRALPSTSKVTIVPNGGLSFVYSKAEVEDDNGDSVFEASESAGLLSLGLGFVFNSRVGVTPTLMIPIGADNSDATFALTGSLHFGTPR